MRERDISRCSGNCEMEIKRRRFNGAKICNKVSSVTRLWCRFVWGGIRVNRYSTHSVVSDIVDVMKGIE